MLHTITSLSLRQVLLFDAIATGATALLLVTIAGLLAGPLGLPEALLRGAGLVLVPFVALVAWTAFREPSPTGAVLTIIAGNAIWVAANLLVLLSGYVAPTLAGYVLIAAQALVVGFFAELQMIALRRSRAIEA